MEPTQPVLQYPEFNEPTYLQPPPPPSPRGPSTYQRNIILGLILLCCLLVIALPFTAYFVLYRPAQANLVTPTSAPTLPHVTPTLNTTAALQTDDFAKFYEAFYDLLNARDFVTIQTAVDTENFQAISLRADPPFPDWQAFKNELTTEQINLSLPRAQLTPDEAGLSCFGYNQTGIAYLHLQITALQLMYVVGTALSPNVAANDPLVALDGTVFIFELPKQNAPTWLWWGVTFNNALGC